jgi:protein gp37/ParB-like chromosome segregation protein Spo0J
MASSIEWTNRTWNPTTGCTRVSAECRFCYAEKETNRLKHNTTYDKYSKGFKEVVEHPETLKQPSTWKEPCTVFVNSMSDLFHEDVSLEFIKKVFEVMKKTPQHTYQILTKREELLEQYSEQLDWTDNIWMGVSVGEQEAVKRIESLVKCGAKYKFISIEPLIEEITDLNFDGIDWVIVGGESGCNKVRPLEKEWVLKIQQQCLDQDTPFFFKQWGKTRNNPNPDDPTIQKAHRYHSKGGCELDGKVYWTNPTIKNNKMTTLNLFGEDFLIMDDINDLITIWELKSHLPSAEESLFENLKEDIKKNGQNDPILYITVANGKKLVVEGHTRLTALIALKKKEILTKELKETFQSLDEIKLWMIKNQCRRRNLSTAEKIRLAYISKPMIEKLAKENLSKAGKANSKKNTESANTEEIKKIDTYFEIAKIAHVGRTTVYRYSLILNSAPQTVIDSLHKGDISIGSAYASLKNKIEPEIDDTDKKFISILPSRNNRQSEINSLKNETNSIELADSSQKNRKVAVKENKIPEIERKLVKTIQLTNIIILQNIDDGQQKIKNGDIDVMMIFNQIDRLNILKENPNVRIGVYYLP